MTEINPETIGDRIRRRRKELRKTLSDIAEEVGVSLAAVSLWERNDSIPSGQRINNLCKALDCTQLWLLEGIEHMTVSPTKTENKYTKYDLEKLSNIFDILPREYRLKVVDYAQNLMDDYYSEMSGKINKIKSMKNK